MSRLCPMSNQETRCTDKCKDCAKEYYRDLKGMSGKAEYVTEEAIKNDLGIPAFELMREYGFIEYCGTLQNKRMYAI